MAILPPGPLLVVRGIPSVLLPPLSVILIRALAQKFLSIDILPAHSIPDWQRGLILLASIPLTVTFRVWRTILRDRRDARANGAILPPEKPSAIGGLDLLRDGILNRDTMYPGEGFAVMSEQLGPMINVRILFENRMLTGEPEYIKAILATQFSSFEKGADSRDMFSDLLGSGVFLADGDLWKFHRAMTRPFFKRDRVSDFALFDRYSLAAIDKIKQRLRDGFPVDFQDVMTRFAMDASGEFLFGYDARTLEAGLPHPHTVSSTSTQTLDKDHAAALQFAASITRAQDATMRRGPLGPAWRLFEFWENQVTKDMGVIRAFLDPILQAAMGGEQKESKLDAEKLTGETVVKDREVQEGETLVEHLLHYTQDRTILRDEILNIGLAGRDTTSTLLTFVIYMLTKHPEVLAKLRAEVLDVVGPTRAPTHEDIREMKYMRAVLNETLRLYPPVPLNMRCTSAPVVLPPVKPGAKPFYIPANTKVPYATIVMHRRPDLWGPDVLQWDPERFIDERLHKYLTPNPFIFLPFSAGPRICLGQQFAYHQASVFLVRLLQNFSGVSLAMDAQPPESHPPAEWKDPEKDPLKWKREERLFVKTHLTLYVNGGVWVRMEEAQ
ncbi:cytochrome P450 [Mycena amicta]|nr:cytochrome P450 [Mycena amicta]